MSFFRAIARYFFGKSIEILDLQIAFHKEANFYGTHGHINASHVDLGLRGELVRFVFLGLSEPPPLTPRVIDFIWEEARAKGFIPTAIVTYGHVLDTHTDLNPRSLISVDRRMAEDANYNRQPNSDELSRRAIAAAASHAHPTDKQTQAEASHRGYIPPRTTTPS